MLRAWHPDRNRDPLAAAVLRRLIALRAAGHGTAADIREIVIAEGRRLRVRVLSARDGLAAESLVTPRSIGRLYPAGHEDLARAAEALITAVSFADDRMRKAMAPALPQLLRGIDLEGGGRLHILKRGPGQVMLQDLLDHGLRQGRNFRPRELAWIVSGLLNIAAWMGWAGIAHAGIDSHSVFVDPATHDVALPGGWEFAARIGARPPALPETVLGLFPGLAAGDGMDERVTLGCIQDIGRQLLGAVEISGNPDVPDVLARWLHLLPPATARAAYAGWIAALEAAWGPRRFIDLGVAETDIHPIT